MKAEFIQYEGGTAVLRVHLGLYGLDPLLRAAHKFTGRCFVHLEPETDDVVLCRFRSKTALANLTDLAGEFANEVLDQALRAKLSTETEPVRRLLLAQAFSRANLVHPEHADQGGPGTGGSAHDA